MQFYNTSGSFEIKASRPSLSAILDFAIVTAVAVSSLCNIQLIIMINWNAEYSEFSPGEVGDNWKDICAVLYRFVKPYSKGENLTFCKLCNMILHLGIKALMKC